VEIAEPVWRDEPVPSAPPPVPAQPLALEAQPTGDASNAPHEIPAPEPPEPLAAAPPSATTHLDSFSLDDVAAGEVPSISAGAVEVSSPAGGPEPIVEMAGEARPPEISAEVQIEPPPTTLVEAVSEAASEPSAEAAPPAESFVGEPRIDLSIQPPAEVYREPSAQQPPLEPSFEIPRETPEEAPAEITSSTLPGPASASVETPTAAPAGAPTSNLPMPPSPPSTIDWDLLYLIVRKIVLKMSPPALSREAAEELARRLADETAFELSAELPSPEP